MQILHQLHTHYIKASVYYVIQIYSSQKELHNIHRQKPHPRIHLSCGAIHNTIGSFTWLSDLINMKVCRKKYEGARLTICWGEQYRMFPHATHKWWNIQGRLRFEFLTVVTVIWVVTLYNLVGSHLCFRGTVVTTYKISEHFSPKTIIIIEQHHFHQLVCK